MSILEKITIPRDNANDESVIWIEDYFKIIINDADITIKNLGSINSIANFVEVNKKD